MLSHIGKAPLVLYLECSLVAAIVLVVLDFSLGWAYAYVEDIRRD